MSSAKPKNGKTSSQDYMNLLYSDSESDTVPDLKLPPIRGKKTRRRGIRRHSDEGICSLWMILRIIVISVLLVSVVTLGTISYLTLQQIDELKDQINSLENKNAATPEDIKALESKLRSINKTVSGIRTGKYGLQDLNRTIVSMQKQITSLTAAAAELQKTVQSPEHNTKENQAVAKTVADLGAGLQLAQAAVETLKTSQKSFASQLEGLAGRVLKLESSGGREHGSSPTSSPQLQELLSEINTTFSRSIGLAMAKLDRQQSQLDAVDKFTQEVDKQVKNVSQVVTSLTEAQQHLAHLVTSQQTSGNASEKADNVSEVTTNSSALISLMKDHQDFVVFRTEMFQDVNYLNASLREVNVSVGVLNKDVEELFSKLGLAMADITNITTVVEGLTHFLQALQNTTRRQQHSNNSTSTTPASSTVSKMPGHTTSPTKPQGSGRNIPAGSESRGEGTPGLMSEDNTTGLSTSEDMRNDKLKEGNEPSGVSPEDTDNTNTGM